jgi:hypothetical protein
MRINSETSRTQRVWKVVLTVFCLSIAVPVPAEQNARPCAEDAARLCKGVQQGQGRIAHCLKEHSNELSPACKENMAAMKEKIKDLVQACKADSEKLCRETKPGEGRVLRCLKQHEGSLSVACKQKLEQSGKQY